LSDEAVLLVPAAAASPGLETPTAHRGNLLFLLLTHSSSFAAVQADHTLIAPAIEEGLRFETPLTTVQRFTPKTLCCKD